MIGRSVIGFIFSGFPTDTLNSVFVSETSTRYTVLLLPKSTIDNAI